MAEDADLLIRTIPRTIEICFAIRAAEIIIHCKIYCSSEEKANKNKYKAGGFRAQARTTEVLCEDAIKNLNNIEVRTMPV